MGRQRRLIDLPHETVWSDDRRYRYRWRREWDPGKAQCNFLMLNPSTADEYSTDNTVAKCIQFCTMWGFGSLVVTNLFALVSTDPAGLLEVDDPVGRENDEHILRAVNTSQRVVCAWGNHGTLGARQDSIVPIVFRDHPDVVCLGVNVNGTPKHPLYVPYDCEPVQFP